MRQMRAPFDDTFGIGIVLDMYTSEFGDDVHYHVKFLRDIGWFTEFELRVVSRAQGPDIE